MSSYIDTPNYPVVSWQLVLDGTDLVSVTIGGTTHSSVIPAGSYYGFATDASGVPTSDSLAYQVAAVIQDIIVNDFGVAAYTCTASYLFLAPGYPRTRFVRSHMSAPATVVTITGGSISIKDLGFNTTMEWDHDIFQTGISSDYSGAGFWAPNNLTVYDDRNRTVTSFVTEGIYTSSVSAVQWGSPKTRCLLTIPLTYAAFIYLYRRQDSGFSDVAQTDVDDPNNLLENLFEQASVGTEFRIYQSAGKYWTAYMTDSSKINDMNSNLEDVSGRGAIWSVTLSFLLLEASGGAI